MVLDNANYSPTILIVSLVVATIILTVMFLVYVHAAEKKKRTGAHNGSTTKNNVIYSFGLLLISALMVFTAWTASPYQTVQGGGKFTRLVVNHSFSMAHNVNAEPIMSVITSENNDKVFVFLTREGANEAQLALEHKKGDTVTVYCLGQEEASGLMLGESSNTTWCSFDQSYNLVEGVQYFKEHASEIQQGTL